MTERRFPLSGEVDMSWSDELQKSLLVLVNETNDDIVVGPIPGQEIVQ